MGFRRVSDWAKDIAYGLPRLGLAPLDDLPARPQPQRPLSSTWRWAIALVVIGAIASWLEWTPAK